MTAYRCSRCDDPIDCDARWCDPCSMDLHDRGDDTMTPDEAAQLQQNLEAEFGPQTSLADDMERLSR